MAYYGFEWRPYVPVRQRRAQARREMDSLRRQGVEIQPVEIDGRKIAKTFWGEAWCDHLESFSDYANRLPRGRTYVRNGSVCHLEIRQGVVQAKVCGSEMYNIRIEIQTLSPKKWKQIKARCAGQIGSLLELLQGRLSSHVLQVVTDRKEGLFPLPGEISLDCDCPDWAVMCKHVAAVLYGVGARLDRQPELLFQLRGVDHQELIAADAEAAVTAATSRGKSKRLASDDLADVFGIDLETADEPPVTKTAKSKTAAKRSRQSPQDKTPAKTTPQTTDRAAKVTKRTAAKATSRSVPPAVNKQTGREAAKPKTATRKKAGSPK